MRSGVSLANFTGHNDAGPETNQMYVLLTSSYYDITLIRDPNQRFEYQKPYYKTSAAKDLRPGFYAGVFLEIKLKNRLSLEPGLAYTQKGIDLDFSSTTESASSQYTYRFVRSINTDYISIPIVLKYSLDRKERFYIIGGIYDAFAIKTRIKDASIYTTATYNLNTAYLPSRSQSVTRVTQINTRVFDCGLVGGAGFSLPLSSRFSIGLDARINVGLINVKGDSSTSGYLDFSANTKNINLETGLRAGYTLR